MRYFGANFDAKEPEKCKRDAGANTVNSTGTFVIGHDGVVYRVNGLKETMQMFREAYQKS